MNETELSLFLLFIVVFILGLAIGWIIGIGMATHDTKQVNK